MVILVSLWCAMARQGVAAETVPADNTPSDAPPSELSPGEEEKKTQVRDSETSSELIKDPPVDLADQKSCQAYIDSILQRVQRQEQRSASVDDPEVAMLAKVGPSHVDLLAGSLSKGRGQYRSDYYLMYAMNALANEDNKEIILKYLPVATMLIYSVNKQNWQQEARPIVLQELRRNQHALPPMWLVVAANYKDPEADEALRRSIEKVTYSPFHILSLAESTTFDVSAIAIKRYKEALSMKDSTATYALPCLAGAAALYGEKGALKTLCDIFTGKIKDIRYPSGSPYYKGLARRIVVRLTGASGSDEEIANWVRDNLSQLTFDHDKRVYVVK